MTKLGVTGRRVATTVLAVALGGCSGSAPESSPDAAGEASARSPIVLAVPVAPLAGLVDALAPGGEIDVLVLVPPGANPATHQPSTDEIRRAAAAVAYLEIDHPAFPMEVAWIDGLLSGSSATRIPVFSGCEFLQDDPHVWTSPGCLRAAAGRTAALLVELVPGSGEEIGRRLEALDARLADLDRQASLALGPYRDRSIVVLHPAWAYLLREHGIRQISILSHGTGAPGAGRLSDLIERARAEGVRTVYVQPQYNAAPARLLAVELGARIVSLDPMARDPEALLRSAIEAFATGFREEGEVRDR